MTRLDTIKQRVAELPTGPGVYLMKADAGKIIYIGKAINLKSRVSGYFTSTETYNHLASYILKHKVHEIDYVLTQNEKEALILEANLVKKHRPATVKFYRHRDKQEQRRGKYQQNGSDGQIEQPFQQCAPTSHWSLVYRCDRRSELGTYLAVQIFADGHPDVCG